MDIRSLQRLLASVSFYKGGIDGDWGSLTNEAVLKVYATDKSMFPDGANAWPAKRLGIAAAQVILKSAGYDPGNIDGLWGNRTEMALRAWDYKQSHGTDEVIPLTPVAESPVQSIKFPLQKDCPTFYGIAGSAELIAQLVYITPPYPLVADWETTTPITKIRFHKKCAFTAAAALQDVVSHYGESEIVRLGLNRFAGSYEPRDMRGIKTPSMHAYGAASDWYAGPNGNTVRKPKALFSQDAYIPWFNIWESHGWVALGRVADRDWMHVQAARLS